MSKDRRSDTELLRAIMANLPNKEALWLSPEERPKFGRQFIYSEHGCEEYQQSDWFKFVAFDTLKILVRVRDEIGGFNAMIEDELPNE